MRREYPGSAAKTASAGRSADEPAAALPAPTRVESLCEALIEAGWLLAAATTPLLFNPYSERSFEPDKVALLRSIVGLMSGAWLWKVLSGGRWIVPAPGSDGSARRAVLPALAVLVAASLLLSAWGSIDPRSSWLGSYSRAQGVWTLLGYLVLFALTASHLVSPAQWRRLAYAIVLASVPVSLYAVLQAVGIDPVPVTRVGHRAHSTLGNPIFLGAYILMVVFVTAVELQRSVAEWRRGAEDDRPTAASPGAGHVAILALALAAQLTALVATQSRGPFLGLLAGALAFCLLALDRAAARPAAAGSNRGLPRRIRLGLIAAGALGLLVLAGSQLPGSSIGGLVRWGPLKRLTRVIDLESSSSRVRQLIWEGAVARLALSEPLALPSGVPDSLHWARRWTGYGPETFPIAFERFHSAELARRAGHSLVADRAHNQTLETLVTTGLLGLSAKTAFFGGVLFVALGGLGRLQSSRRAAGLGIALVGGALGGALLPVAAGEAAWIGVGVSTGLVLGLLLFLLTGARARGVGQGPARSSVREGALFVAIVATFVAHAVETTFGITITTTQLFYWLLAAVLVAAARGCLETPVGGHAGRPPIRRGSGSATLWPYGLLYAAVSAPLVFGLLLDPAAVDRGAAALGESMPPVRWVVTGLLLAALAAAIGLTDRAGTGMARQRPVYSALQLVLAGLVPLAVYTAVHWARLSRGAALVDSGADDGWIFAHQAGHFATLIAFVLALHLATGLAIGFRCRDSRRWSRSPAWRSLALGAAIALPVGWLVERANLRPIAADTYRKEARWLVHERPQRALEALERAAVLTPAEPRTFLALGRASLAAARLAERPDARQALLERAETALGRARELAPFDGDAMVDLAAVWRFRGEIAADPAARERDFAKAAEALAAAAVLRPGRVEVLVERGLLQARRGDLGAAVTLLEEALEIDPRSVETRLGLGEVWRLQAARAGAEGDGVGRRNAIESALAAFETARLLDPGSLAAGQAVAEIETLLVQLAIETPDTQRLRELYGNDDAIHRRLARKHLERGRLDRALRHARLGFELAAEDERPAAAELLRQVLAAIPNDQPLD